MFFHVFHRVSPLGSFANTPPALAWPWPHLTDTKWGEICVPDFLHDFQFQNKRTSKELQNIPSPIAEKELSAANLSKCRLPDCQNRKHSEVSHRKQLAVLAILTSRAPQFCWMHHQPKEIRDGGHQPGHGRHKLRENLFQILLPRYHKFVIVNSLLSRYRKSIPEIWSPALTSSSARRVPIEHKWHFAQCVLRCSAIRGAKAVKCGQGHTKYWPPMAS